MVDRLRPKSIRHPGSPCAWAPGDGKIVGTIEYTDVIDGTGTVLVGTIPAGARFIGKDSGLEVITAFNGGANNALTVGIASDYDYIITDGHPTEADSTSEAELLDWNPTSDQLIYARFTHTGAAPTTGKAIVTVYFDRPL
jgi:hypothetical protein